MDPDDLMQCPYDPNHQVRRSRMPYHIRDCKKNNPVAVKTKKKNKTCPFNSLHIVPPNEFEHHKTVCPDRSVLHRAIMHECREPSVNDMPIVNHNIESSENWDDDPAISAPFFLNGGAMIKYPGLSQTQPAISNVVSIENTCCTGLKASSQPQPLRSVRMPAKPPLALADEVHTEQQSQNSGGNFQSSHLTSAGPLTQQAPSLKYAGVGRGQIPQAKESVAPGTVRQATGSVAFNLNTLHGRPPPPQESGITWPSVQSDDSSKLTPPSSTATTNHSSVLEMELPGVKGPTVRPAVGKRADGDSGSNNAVKRAEGKNSDVSKKKLTKVTPEHETADEEDLQGETNNLKEERKLRKKLKAIQQLEADLAIGKKLDKDQIQKVESKAEVEQKLAALKLQGC